MLYPPCILTFSHIISGYILLPQATACSVLINLPFIEFPYLSPNASVPSRASITSAITPVRCSGMHGTSDPGEEWSGSRRGVYSRSDERDWGGDGRRKV